jgi:hypothetical protein
VKEAKKDLKELNTEIKTDETERANAEERKAFREATELHINTNEARIAELRVKLKIPGKKLDRMYELKLEKLEQENRAMKVRLDRYEKNQTDWEVFKTEFNHDMVELDQSLKNITVVNDK